MTFQFENIYFEYFYWVEYDDGTNQYTLINDLFDLIVLKCFDLMTYIVSEKNNF